MKDQKKAYVYGLTTVLMWSTVASAFKLSLASLSVIQLLFYASLSSTLVLALVLAAQGKLGLVLRFTPRQYAVSLGLGLVNPFLYYIILFSAYDLLPAQEAQPINYTWAIALSLLAIPFLKQKISFLDMCAVCTGYLGVAVIATHGDLLGLRFSSPLGVGLALLSTLVWAMYWIVSARDDRDPVAGLFMNFAFSLPASGLACAFGGGFAAPWTGLLGAAYVGAFEMGLAFACWLTALKYAENTARIANLIFISPFLSLYLIHVFVGESIHPSTYVGLALILAGLALQRAGKKPAPGA